MEHLDDLKHLAVLIDAENVSAKYVKSIFDELDKNGFDAPCRRIYGNWAKFNGWKESVLLDYSIQPIQQFSYTVGKNGTDMAMVIDAMDLLHQDKMDGFCLITSDSDFTRLAMRLREERKFVFGMGESKAPMALTHACDKFIFLDLIDESTEDGQQAVAAVAKEDENPESVTSIEALEDAILNILNGDGDGEMHLGELGDRLGKKFPDFDVRNYGYSKLSVFFKEKMPHLELVKQSNQYLVRKGHWVDREEIEREIIAIIRRKGGKVDNLSVIYSELLQKYNGLDIRDYGYGRISSFLRSMKDLKVVDNTVRIK
ncbi:MAG: NYN domain-containing protein [Clostridium sp.]|nr:NYN domain-containing protein [Acetatifactor muris]MCM1527048.1 NYN domain-containing protein [Bacteroides sp.]MCM1562025.1 NYN domain-containing protein [Clostridium sp.]